MMQRQASFLSLGSKILIISLVSAGVFTAIIGLVDEETTVLLGNLAYVPIHLAWVLTAFFSFVKLRKTQSERFLLVFLITAVLWFVADMAWTVLELVYEEDPFPSIADHFYIVGYLTMFTALGIVIFPHIRKISFDVKLIAASLSLALLVPLILLTQTQEYDNVASAAISYSYPVLDVILLWFCIVGALVFSKKMDFMYYLIAGLLALIVADTEFAISSISETYHVGQLSEVFFYWSYILLAFAAYRVYKSPLQKPSEIQLRTIMISGKTRIALVVFTFVLLVGIIVSAIAYFGFTNFSPNEERVIIPSLYASSFAVFLTIVTHAAFHKKKTNLVYKLERIETLAQPTDQLVLLQKQISRLEAATKKNTMLTIIGMTVLGGIMLFYVSTNFIEGPSYQTELVSGKYFIENLKGDRIDTWVAWQISKDKTIQVTVINSAELSQEKLKAINDPILSESSIVLENAFMNKDPPNETSLYHLGWKGALSSISKIGTKYNVPTNFQVDVSEKSVGDIVIILSTAKETDGSLGFTRSIADENTNQILKSFITIFDVDNLDGNELSAIVRHEFGHAMGLGHSTDEMDLMYPEFSSNQAFISECDLDAMASLYNGEKISQVVCRH
ncbi:MAG TPA: matrixin family metalloprotease [Candidatus Nitrosotenuis sp.]|jgi:hypothetical protein